MHAGSCTRCSRAFARAFRHHAPVGRGCRTQAAAEVAKAPHTPVLLQEVIHTFSSLQLKTYVDGTLGAGGHAAALLQAHPEMAHLIGFDQDPVARELAAAKLGEHDREGLAVDIVADNFRNIQHQLEALQVFGGVDGILLDLGISSMHIDDAARGFSFMRDGPLDMRMNPTAGESAADAVNTWSETKLGHVIRDYGEDKLWKVIARRIVDARSEQPITTTHELVDAIGRTQRHSKGGKGGKSQGNRHAATRTFQALRIAVNDEMRACEEVIPAAIQALRPGGRLAVISFHRLEDRIVKKAMRGAAGFGAVAGQDALLAVGTWATAALQQPDAAIVKLVTRKPILPSEEEVSENVRARSAMLRVVEKL